MMYYKIPPKYVEEFGMANTFVKFPDGNYFVPRAFMARINPDIDNALEMCGGVAVTLDQARDEQLGLIRTPMPGDEENASFPGTAGESNDAHPGEEGEQS